jgi:hypothetical protein
MRTRSERLVEFTISTQIYLSLDKLPVIKVETANPILSAIDIHKKEG